MNNQSITKKFFELIQISLGIKKQFEVIPTNEEWTLLLRMSQKQSMAGLLFEGMKQVMPAVQGNKPTVFFEWYSIQQHVATLNKRYNNNSQLLFSFFKKNGLESCIIKGQGIARLYPTPEYRQCGDIDIWVNGNRDEIIAKLQENFIGLSLIDYVNCHADFFKDTEVEVHFRPTYMFNPFINRKVQKWIRLNKDEQMKHFDKELGFSYPEISFNLVFALIHIYRHIFSEGIGLRQLTDYYYILKNSSESERKKAFDILDSFGLRHFTSAIMFIMKEVFALEDTYMLCNTNVSEGEFILSEILQGGNFGKYDERTKRSSSNSRWQMGLANAKRNLRFLKHYPNEVLWIPTWKLWHWCWRKYHGYL